MGCLRNAQSNYTLALAPRNAVEGQSLIALRCLISEGIYGSLPDWNAMPMHTTKSITPKLGTFCTDSKIIWGGFSAGFLYVRRFDQYD
jgi:hypothetical protein